MPVVDRGMARETAALIGAEGLPARQGDQGSISAFPASADQFFPHRLTVFSRIS